MYAPLPLSPRRARHFPRNRGQLTTKEEKIHSFYYFIYAFNDILCRILRSHSYFVYIFQFFTHACHRSRMTAGVNYIFKEFFTVVLKRKNRKRKPSPNDGKIRKACKSQAVPACREASEPLFEERSDTVKVSETLCLG